MIHLKFSPKNIFVITFLFCVCFTSNLLAQETVGCTDNSASNYAPDATEDDGSCIYPLTAFEVGDFALGGIVFYIDETIGLVVALEDVPETYPWGCYGIDVEGADGEVIGTGYQNTLDIVEGCTDSLTAASIALLYESGGYSDWFLPSKEEIVEIASSVGQGGTNIAGTHNSAYYWTSTEAYSSTSYVYNFGSNSIFGGLSKNSNCKVRTIRSFQVEGCFDTNTNEICDSIEIVGCFDPSGLNYNPEATLESVCTYYESPYQIGDLAEGGRVFYIDETEGFGLIAAPENLPDFYQWGCSGIDIEGADGEAIGDGYQNTLDIVNADCGTTNGFISQAQAALEYESEGYSDWYLPSINELIEFDFVLGDYSEYAWGQYFSSTEINSYAYYLVSYDNYYSISKTYEQNVIPIRTFYFCDSLDESCGMNVTENIGCTDIGACNFDLVATVDDGTCEYPMEGYTCGGNLLNTTYQIGDTLKGGILFYMDEDSNIGMVAAIEDITEGAYDTDNQPGFGFEWGCKGVNIDGADGFAIGTGYQNTLDIIAQSCTAEYENSELTAAAIAYNYIDGVYDDWYLPSRNELY